MAFDQAHRVFVTGATSTVGPLLLPLLDAQGIPVLVYGRSAAKLPASVRWHFLDLADHQLHLPHVEADTLFHTAALWLLPGWIEKFYQRGVRRIVAFSSTSRYTKGTSANPYEREVVNKLISAEELVARECERLGIHWTIFRPTLIYGGFGDRNVGDIARLIRRFGVFPVFGQAKGLRQPVHAADLAKACIKVLNEPRTYNKAYNLSGGETLSYSVMVRKIFEAVKRRPRVISIPIGVFRLAVRVARLHPRFAHLTPDMALRMQVDLVFDHSDAVADFGYAPDVFRPDY